MARHAQPPALRAADQELTLREEGLYKLWTKKVNALMDLRGLERTDANKARALREIRMIIQSFRRTKKLLECEAESIWDAVADAAGLGLELGGAASECALIPYGKRCELVVEYGGKIKLMLQHPLVKDVNVQLWRENDEFDYNPATQEIKHRRLFNEDRGELVGAYCIVTLVTGGRRTCVMDTSEIYEHGVEFSGTTWDDSKKKMVYGEEGFLVKWWDDSPQKRRAYMLKTVVHMVAKTAPKSAALAHAMRLDGEAAEAQAAHVIDAEFADVDGGPPPPPNGSTPPPNRTPPEDFMPPMDPDGHPEPGSGG